MKKKYLFVIVILVSCQPSKQDRIKEYKGGCLLSVNEKIDRDFARIRFITPMDSLKVLYEDNCQCKAEQLVERFSNSELERILSLPDNETKQIVDPVIKPCMVVFEKKITQFLDREKERQESLIDAINQKTKPDSTPKAPVSKK
ncbi:hypothetical protein KXD93_16710 [Mucilaginibacter sp. BJC16-A38]|uniref:hypothetical protein n=1 Tax=Mucilaginibacter phenanthrenivorans TaxID=1234842 RepID=UPI0021581756|nr:hypothetical protein [Mucilaginibacter phenanthrenivorans]MCR8559301.1 hypothetical protein [Mucilaginibacter phenanthrenivorans]